MADKKRREDEARQKADAEAADKKRQEDEARQKAEADTAAQRQARRGGEEDRRGGRERPAIDGARPPARPGRADRARLRHRQHQRDFRQPHARGDRRLAEGEERAGDRLPDGRTEPGAAARRRAGGGALRRRAEEARGSAQEGRRGQGQGRSRGPPARAGGRAPSPPPAPAPAAPSVATAAPRSGPDGLWAGTYHCSPSRGRRQRVHRPGSRSHSRAAPAPGSARVRNPARWSATSRSRSGSLARRSRSRASTPRATGSACSRRRR